MDVTVVGGGLLTSTAGHKFYVMDRGWTVVSDLRLGDLLRTPDGSVRAVTALRDRASTGAALGSSSTTQLLRSRRTNYGVAAAGLSGGGGQSEVTAREPLPAAPTHGIQVWTINFV
ncbi:hypothetical protein [Streptomyces sp. H27-C3]|uniref:hypothetical protein n=1 Tax=Streptomyces sp. H27-C3 TaxID=3046305 RepID=UPI0024BA9AA3|nr:hypothetical protein [Streptomyces sp. H27-C3]MDJ0462574.1 hypothetical protein [Streptomyces sp. H27-C3]